jgi:hypothetical protein
VASSRAGLLISNDNEHHTQRAVLQKPSAEHLVQRRATGWEPPENECGAGPRSASARGSIGRWRAEPLMMPRTDWRRPLRLADHIRVVAMDMCTQSPRRIRLFYMVASTAHLAAFDTPQQSSASLVPSVDREVRGDPEMVPNLRDRGQRLVCEHLRRLR